MRNLLWIVTVAAGLSACSRAGPAPTPPATEAGGLDVPSEVESVAVFELANAAVEADRRIGTFSRQGLLARFPDLRRRACSRGLRLVLVAYGPGGTQTRPITLDGRLTGVRFLAEGHRFSGVEIPC